MSENVLDSALISNSILHKAFLQSSIKLLNSSQTICCGLIKKERKSAAKLHPRCYFLLQFSSHQPPTTMSNDKVSLKFFFCVVPSEDGEKAITTEFLHPRLFSSLFQEREKNHTMTFLIFFSVTWKIDLRLFL